MALINFNVTLAKKTKQVFSKFKFESPCTVVHRSTIVNYILSSESEREVRLESFNVTIDFIPTILNAYYLELRYEFISLKLNLQCSIEQITK